MKDSVELYQSEDGKTSVNVLYEQATDWLTQQQMGELFATTPENVLTHLESIREARELEEPSTTRRFLVVQTESKRQVERDLQHYNLDAIISVGYRVNSKRCVKFRLWATGILRERLLQGYTLTQQHFEQSATASRQAHFLIEKACLRSLRVKQAASYRVRSMP